MVWSQDLNDPQRRAVEEKLREAAGRIVDDPKVKVYDAMALAGMVQTHPGVAMDAGLISFGSALSLDELLEGTSLFASDRPFIADQAREELIDRICDRVARSEDPLLMSLLGDPGAGKLERSPRRSTTRGPATACSSIGLTSRRAPRR
jgi:hypothetical protein